MVVDDISEFLINNTYRSKFLAIDFGLKNLGLAISDQTNLIAIPFKTLSERQLLNEIIEIVESNNIYGIIIGKPYNLDGSDSKMIVNVNLFIERILRVQNFPIYLIDERLSSKQYKTSTNTSKNAVIQKSACLI
jgi:putative Holliday junction resolvase